MATYPDAVDPDNVGTYPAVAKSGAGYFYDEVLEYRVWCHPEQGAADEHGGEDYYYAFATFAEAAEASAATPGAEPVLALVRQREWVDEPAPGQFEHRTDERVTEWLTEWLVDGPRTERSIPDFLAQRR